MLLSEAWSLYKQYRTLRPKTLKDYESVLMWWCIDLLDADIETWTKRLVVDFYLHVASSSVAQANKLKRLLTAIWNFANNLQDGKLGAVCPFKHLGELRLLKRLQPRKTRLYERDFLAFFEGVKTLNRQEQAWMQIMLFTGLRHASALQLRWEHVDWSRGVLDVPGDLQKNHDPIVCVLSALPLDILRRLHARARCPQSGPMFPDVDNRCYEKVILPAGGYARPHDLRRTHASIVGELGYNEYVIKRVLGHRTGSSNVTENYCQYSDAFLREVNMRVVGVVLGN